MTALAGSFDIPHTCPHCGRQNEAATGASPGAIVPTPGSVSICWSCHGVGIFYNGPLGMATRLPSPEELESIDADAKVQRILRALRASRARGSG